MTIHGQAVALRNAARPTPRFDKSVQSGLLGSSSPRAPAVLRIEFAQPDKDGRLLAIVEMPTPKAQVSDLALIRMSPEAVAILPDWHSEIPGDLQQQLMGARRSMYLDTVERDIRTWKDAGYEIIEHHRNVPMRWTNDASAGAAVRITQSMLRNPIWLAAKEAQVLRVGLGTARAGSASPRL